METITIDVSNPQALKLLEDLEALNLIKVVSRQAKPVGQKLSEKYGGKLAQSVADELQHYVAQSRKEWDSRTSI